MTRERLAAALMSRHGRTFAEELGIDLAGGSADALFQWFCAALLFGARIGAAIAVKAARSLFDHGWTTAESLAASTWEDRTRVLNASGYARYDESTSRELGDAARRMLDTYGGDLDRLRRRAENQPGRERALLKEFKGIGDVAADIFLREIQGVWSELYPFADAKALDAARRLGLGADAGELATLVEPGDFPRLVAALVRAALARDVNRLLSAARPPGSGATPS